MRIRRIHGLVLAVIALIVAGAVPAGASQPSAGALAFDGVAHLNQFQCAAGNCAGSYVGQASGSIGGIAAGVPWSATIAEVPFTASFTYGDSCFGVGIAEGGGT